MCVLPSLLLHLSCVLLFFKVLIYGNLYFLIAQAITSGGGSGAIFLDDVACTGNESTLLACISRPIGTNNCVHSEDAGVQCVPGTF